jgi:hypothetical protein
MGIFSKPGGGGVTADSTDTLTNKTIDGDDNTIQDVAESSLKTASGASGTVLTSNGAGVAPTYQAAGGGAWSLITSTTASAAASVDFTGLSSTYMAYRIVYNNVFTDGVKRAISIRLSTDNGSTWLTTGYEQFIERVDIDAASVTKNDIGGNGLAYGLLTNTKPSATGNSVNGVLNLLAHDVAANHTSWFGDCIIKDESGNRFTYEQRGLNTSASAVDAIQFRSDNGAVNISGTFRLYGLTAS